MPPLFTRLLKGPRTLARDALFAFLRKAFATDDGRQLTSEALTGLLDGHPTLAGKLHFGAPPYAELGRCDHQHTSALRADIVFITGRFRSGSTLLWNLFRHVPGCTAYYEPFNERRWFDASVRGEHTDRSHRGVEEYWREYDGLVELGRYYREEWIARHLLMEADLWAPEMKRYIEILIERAPGRPVLQFNRVDFRLPWLRRNFPNAKILHLYRHPRDQWCSTLGDLNRFPRDAAPETFAAQDGFYLLTWARDLSFHFPFLAEAAERHPYETFYYIWRLSYLYGIHYADFSLSFERLINDADHTVSELLAAVDLDQSHVQRLNSLIERPRLDRWREYAEDEWFAEREARCESTLADFFGVSPPIEAPYH